MKKFLGLLLMSVMLLGIVPANAANTAEDKSVGMVDVQNYTIFDVTGGMLGVTGSVSTCEASAAVVGTLESIENFEDYAICETTLVAIDDTTYNIVAPNGEVIGVYDAKPVATTRGSWDYSWTVKAGQLVGSDSYVSSYNGLEMSFTMYFSSKGDSEIGIIAVEDRIFYKVFDRDDSFSGTITFSKDLGDVAFAISNCSGHTITYSGTLSY